MKHVTKDEPEVAPQSIDDIIEYIDYKAPRVKWGIPESIGNIAQKFPDKVEKAIPKLLSNTKDEGKVVRWCVAFALTEIAKNNPKIRCELIPRIEEIAKRGKNNGLKNVYLRALITIEKNQKK